MLRRATRLRLQALARLSKRYLDELEALMGDASPIVRARALADFRKTVFDGSSGVHVNVNQAFLQSPQPSSFEAAMDKIRALHMREHAVSPAVPSSRASR